MASLSDSSRWGLDICLCRHGRVSVLMSTNHFFVLALQGDSFCKNVCLCSLSKKKKNQTKSKKKKAALVRVQISCHLFGKNFRHWHRFPIVSHLSSYLSHSFRNNHIPQQGMQGQLPGLVLESLRAWAQTARQTEAMATTHLLSRPQLWTNRFWPQKKAQKTLLTEELWSQLCTLFSFSPLHNQKLFRFCEKLADMLLSSTNSRSEHKQ